MLSPCGGLGRAGRRGQNKKKKQLHSSHDGKSYSRGYGYRDKDDSIGGYYEHRLEAVRFGSQRWWKIYESSRAVAGPDGCWCAGRPSRAARQRHDDSASVRVDDFEVQPWKECSLCSSRWHSAQACRARLMPQQPRRSARTPARTHNPQAIHWLPTAIPATTSGARQGAVRLAAVVAGLRLHAEGALTRSRNRVGDSRQCPIWRHPSCLPRA